MSFSYYIVLTGINQEVFNRKSYGRRYFFVVLFDGSIWYGRQILAALEITAGGNGWAEWRKQKKHTAEEKDCAV